MMLQINFGADEVLARCFYVEFVVQSTEVAAARLAAWRLLT